MGGAGEDRRPPAEHHLITCLTCRGQRLRVHLNPRPELQRSCLQPERAAQPPALPSAAVAAVAPLVLAALFHLVLIVTGDIVTVGATAAAARRVYRAFS